MHFNVQQMLHGRQFRRQRSIKVVPVQCEGLQIWHMRNIARQRATNVHTGQLNDTQLIEFIAKDACPVAFVLDTQPANLCRILVADFGEGLTSFVKWQREESVSLSSSCIVISASDNGLHDLHG